MSSSRPDIAFVCPACRRPLERISRRMLRCPGEDGEFIRDGGIWRFPSPQAAAGIDRFVADYRRLRHDEGWGTVDAAYYLELPFRDITGRHTDIWRIRAASYELLCRRILTGGRRRVADLGAGNCWLSWRFTEAGHTVAAVDLSDDPLDGLAAAAAYPKEASFLRIQSMFDRVPLGDGELDLAIFNGSLHYSTDPERTLGEALRLIGHGGRVVIMDTPVYRRESSGKRMLKDREKQWRQDYGPDFGTLPAEGFLTRRRLRRLGDVLGIRWRLHPLPLGWRWHLAPIAALALGRREPARFPLIVGRSD